MRMVTLGENPNAFRAAESPRPGAAFVSLPSDVMDAAAPEVVLTPVSPVRLGPGPKEAIADAARRIDRAQRPVLLLGMLASEPRLSATTIQTVGSKGYDGFTLALVTMDVT